MSNIFVKPTSSTRVLSEQHLSDIEQASLRAWPALEEQTLGGWRMRFSRGFTKRANSVSIPVTNGNPGSETELLKKIEVCEQLYHDRSLPTIFRLVQVTEQDKNISSIQTIDNVLANRNYRFCDASLVLAKALTTTAFSPGTLNYVDLPTWLTGYQQISSAPAQVEHLHRLILEGIQTQLLLALTRHKRESIACALGVLDGPLLGLFDIATHPAYREQGFARSLVQGLCAQGADSGAKTVYLQVQEDNFAAIALYVALGFTPAYRYGYRIEDTKVRPTNIQN